MPNNTCTLPGGSEFHFQWSFFSIICPTWNQLF